MSPLVIGEKPKHSKLFSKALVIRQVNMCKHSEWGGVRWEGSAHFGDGLAGTALAGRGATSWLCSAC